MILETREWANSVAANNADDRLVSNVDDGNSPFSVRPALFKFEPNEDGDFGRLTNYISYKMGCLDTALTS